MNEINEPYWPAEEVTTDTSHARVRHPYNRALKIGALIGCNPTEPLGRQNQIVLVQNRFTNRCMFVQAVSNNRYMENRNCCLQMQNTFDDSRIFSLDNRTYSTGQPSDCLDSGVSKNRTVPPMLALDASNTSLLL